MSIPDFSKLEFVDPQKPPVRAFGAPWLSPEGIPVKPVYDADDLAGIDFPRHLPWHRALPARPLSDHVRDAAVDRAPVRRLLHGGRFQRLLPAQSRRRPEGPLGRFRSRHPPRLRFRSSARWRRCRHGRRRDQFDLRHADAVLRHSARPDVGVDDHERRGAARDGALHRRGGGARRSAGEAVRHDPERHPQRVHGAQHLHLSARLPRCGSSPTSSPTPRQHMPKFNSISISGYHMQEAGATPDLELAYTLADGVEYVRAGITAGLDIDRFAPRLSFFWAIGMNFFMEVAKHARRAAAVGEARQAVQSEVRQVADRCAPMRRPRAGRSPSQDVFNNVVRTCIEAMAATQGHTQSLHTNALDEALALPTDFSARIARNTQLFLQQESGTTRIADAWGGSFYVERLTHALANKAWEHLQEIEAARRHGESDRSRHPEAAHRGSRRAHPGAHRCRPADRRRRQCLQAAGREGRSKCCGSTIPPCARCRLDKLARLKRERDPEAVKAALASLTRAASGGNGNLLALAIDAARAKATVGEISFALEEAYGRHRAEIRAISGVYKREAGADVRQRRTGTEAGRAVRARTKVDGRAFSSPRSARMATTAARR